MPLRDAQRAPGPLFRIGRPPDSLAWPRPRARPGINRFDDPLGEFRVLYAGASRRVCFLETLALARPSLALLNQLRLIRSVSAAAAVSDIGAVPADFLDRMIGSFVLDDGQRWLDFRSGDTFQALREEHPEVILGFGYEEFDASHALGADRDLTQAIARIAYDAGFNGIVYPSRVDPTHECWALFDRARIIPIATTPIADDDVDLREVAALFGLRIGQRHALADDPMPRQEDS